jgi:hypothetical protein
VFPVRYELNVNRSALCKYTPTTSTKSVQTPKVNSSSLSDMFKVVTELNRAESEVDKIVAITKIIRIHEARGLLDSGPSSRQRGHSTSTKPQLSDGNKKVVLVPRRGLAPRLTDQLTVGCNVTLTLDVP